MNDDPIQQAPQDNPNAQDKKTKGKNIKGAETKREVGKRVIFGAFGGLITYVAFSIHDWTFWIFLIPGLYCLSYCLCLELKHLAYKRRAARGWAVILFAGGLLIGLAYRLRDEATQQLPVDISEAKLAGESPVRIIFSTDKGAVGITNNSVLKIADSRIFILAVANKERPASRFSIRLCAPIGAENVSFPAGRAWENSELRYVSNSFWNSWTSQKSEVLQRSNTLVFAPFLISTNFSVRSFPAFIDVFSDDSYYQEYSVMFLLP
jgi:hypothetical protein